MKILILLTLSFATFANSKLDNALRELIKNTNLVPLEKSRPQDRNLVHLGHRLFSERLLSGNEDITCMHCHHPRLGTSDAIPLSIGTGGVGLGTGRIQNLEGAVVKRNSPATINLGYDDITDMFWDGRVKVDKKKGIYISPSKELNANRAIITNFTNALALQTIFPLLSTDEMLGKETTLSKFNGDFGKWNEIINRLLNGKHQDLYRNLFKQAFPEDYKNGKINISHVGNALGAFLTHQFNLVDTPFDEYLKGDNEALSLNQKKGLKVFLTNGKCIECHNGKHLSDFKYDSVAAPQIGIEGTSHLNDTGRYEVTKNKEDRFRFRTPPLRNILLTGPYMHSGSLKTIRDVVQHYSSIKSSLYRYRTLSEHEEIYEEILVKDINEENNAARFNAISKPFLKRGLELSKPEQENLIEFLEFGLLDRRLQSISK